jgi:UDP-N-acetylmuramyl pentapeptide synthase
MKKYFSRFRIDYLKTLLYMLQLCEYDSKKYIEWNQRTMNYGEVMKRQSLVWTKKAKLLFGWMVLFEMSVLAGVLVSMIWFDNMYADSMRLVAIILLPVVTQYAVLLPLALGRVLIQGPREKQIIREAIKKLARHKGYKVAVVGSYGKTTAKEVLKTVLSVGKKVAATPGNVNQPLGIAKFIMGLDGDEDVLIFEMGEYRMGDIYEMCRFVAPDTGVITGVSEAHLETFGSLKNIVDTLFGLKKYVGHGAIYLNGDCDVLAKKTTEEDVVYTDDGVGGWKVSKIGLDAFGTSFVLSDEKNKIDVFSKLIGKHNISIVALAVYLADQLGVSGDDIKRGLGKLEPFEHRMQPRAMNGAVVIDDTYNGNIEGVRAGVELLKTLPASRKIYVTPGLVEQGEKTKQIHEEIGKLLSSGVDEVVLMRNSVTAFIEDSMKRGKFCGRLTVIDEPLEFYENVDRFVASGDLVLMQNDWTDNYS